MAGYPVEEFANEIEALPTDDEGDLLTYIAWSARLAALPNGDDRLLREWPKLVAQARSTFDLSTALRNRSREGLWDLQYAIGEELGLAMIAAQDFHCFWKREGDLLDPATREDLGGWFFEAEETSLDEQAAETLRTFIEQFPLLPEFRLSAVDAPLSTFAAAFIASGHVPRPTIRTTWRVPVRTGDGPPETMRVLEYATADVMGVVTERLMRRMDREATISFSDGGSVSITRSLAKNWLLRVNVKRGMAPLSVRAVRLGLLPARCAAGSLSKWEVDLQNFSLQEKLNALLAPVAVSLRSGDRITITDDQ